MTLEHVIEILREHPFLEGFRPDHVEKLAAFASEVHFGRNELIFHEGDASSLFYLLLSGSVALEVPTPGRTLRIATLAHGDELGWSSLLPSLHTKQFQARSLEDVSALAFDGERVRHACDADCAFGYAVLGAVARVMADRLQATRMQLIDIYAPVGAKG